MKLVGRNFQAINITGFNKLNFSIKTQDGFKIPYCGTININKGEIPVPYILDFQTSLPENTIVYASIDNKNYRVCNPINIAYGWYQLDFTNNDFNTSGRKKLLIWFVTPQGNIQYIHDKYDFLIKC